MKNENENFELEKKNVDEDYDLCSLIFQLLEEMGCQPEREEDDTIVVMCQGERFVINTGKRVARIWDPGWRGIKADDPRLDVFKEAVNQCNYQGGPTIVYSSSPDEDGDIVLHSRFDIMLHPACPENFQYFKAVISSFFDAKENFNNHFNLMG